MSSDPQTSMDAATGSGDETAPDTPQERLLARAARLSCIAENGLHFSTNDFDRERYAEIAQIAIGLTQQALEEPDTAPPPSRDVLMAPGRNGTSTPATPLLGVRGFALKDNHVVLVRERSDGGWCLPGGIAEVGLSPAASMEKEWREETQSDGRLAELIAVHDKPPRANAKRPQHWFELVYRMEALETLPPTATFADNPEISAVDWFALDRLPTLSFHRTSERLLRDLTDLVLARSEIASTTRKDED